MGDPVRTVNIQDAKTHLSRLLREVEAGETVAIARAGRVIAHLVRAEQAGPREWGFMAGDVTWSDDAFDPLGDDEAAEWEGPLDP